ncbi:MAG: Holliday junction resolvase RuvX [Vampirovibrionales bacterium]
MFSDTLPADVSVGIPHKTQSSSELIFTMPSEMPASGVLMSFDYGTKRVGYAYCDPSQTMVLNAGTVGNRKELLQACQQVHQRYPLAGFVVGMPKHLSGEEGQSAQEAKQLAQFLHKHFPTLPIALCDERLTSKWAHGVMHTLGHTPSKQKAMVDALAAHRILEDFLDGQRLRPPVS